MGDLGALPVNMVRWEAEQLSILVVEDDDMFNLMYTHFLTDKGAIVTRCARVDTARRLLLEDETAFHCVILDNQLEDGEGIELLDDIKVIKDAPAVIFASGNDQPRFLLNAFEKGVDDYMLKPLSLDLLWIKINNCIGNKKTQWIARQQKDEIARRMDEQQQEQMLAQHLFQHMFSDINKKNSAVKKMLLPSGIFSGDAILSFKGQDGSWYFMLADAMGHGLAPAISLLPVMQIYKGMGVKSLPLSNIVYELNKTLNSLLPDDRFVAAVFVRIDPNSKIIDIYNAGMPNPILMGMDRTTLPLDITHNMALGILSDDLFDPITVSYPCQELKHIFIYSDGLTEVATKSDGCLSKSGIISIIKKDDFSTAHFRSLFDENNCMDDISFCFIDVDGVFCNVQNPSVLEMPRGGGLIEVNVKYTGSVISDVDLPSKVIGFLKERNVSIDYQQRVFTVIAELFSNSIDHGILKLDSAIKNKPDGFLEYYQERLDRLQCISNNDQIGFDMKWIEDMPGLEVEIYDSGGGFLIDEKTINPENAHGRGLGLVKKLVDDFQILDSGSRMRFVMKDRISIC